MFQLRLVGCVIAAIACLAPAASAAEVAHSLAFGTNTNGGIAVAANTSMTCAATTTGCTAALNGTATGSDLNNNRFPGVYADVDSDATTFSSSSALLDLPEGATVLYALLTWGGDSTNAGKNVVKLQGPSGGAYTSVTATGIGTRSDNYAAWVDITAIVQAQGAGEYTVANVRGDAGKEDSHAGWQIVVAYRDSAAPPRNLAIFTGFTAVRPGAGDVTILINGFETPATGAVRSSVTTLGFEGDLGITGDQLRLEGTLLSDAANTSNNAFNSTISQGGVINNGRQPAPRNTLGIDSDTFDTVNLIANGATDAQLTMSTSNDVYNLATVGVATELYAPDLTVQKLPTDLNGALVEPNDVIEYEVTVTNDGADGAINVAFDDAIPANTTYEAGTLSVTQPGGAATALTDAAGDDAGQFNGTSVLVNLGTGATSAAGGTLAPGAVATIRFQVRVDPALTAGGEIRNTAHVQSNGQSLVSATFEDESNVVLTVEGKAALLPDLLVELDQDTTSATAGVATRIDIAVTNQGTAAATGSTITGSIGTGVTSLRVIGLTGCSVTLSTGTFSCPLGTVAAGDRIEFELEVVVSGAGSYPIATTVATPLEEMTLVNNSDSGTLEVAAGPTVLSTTIAPAKRVIQAGSTVRVRAVLRNIGAANAERPELCVTVPPGMSVVHRGGGQLRSGRLCWSWSSLGAGRSTSVVYTLRAARTVADRALRSPRSSGNADNAGAVMDLRGIRIVGGSGYEPVTG